MNAVVIVKLIGLSRHARRPQPGRCVTPRTPMVRGASDG
jgi:hypothetical protein